MRISMKTNGIIAMWLGTKVFILNNGTLKHENKHFKFVQDAENKSDTFPDCQMKLMCCMATNGGISWSD